MFEGYELASLTARARDLAPGAQQGGMRGSFKAQVVDVQPGKATLNIDGKTVVAETDAPLTLNAEYDVVVKGFNGNKVQLQIVTGPQGGGQGASDAGGGVRTLTDNELTSRLAGFDLPEHPKQVVMARSLMNAGMPVTRENVLALAQAAPPDASQKDVDFLVSMMKNGQQPSREALNLMPLLEEHLGELPKNMTALFEAAKDSPGFLDRLATMAQKARDNAPGGLPMRNLESILIKPDSDTLSLAADKLQAAGKQFFTASEARLSFLDGFQAAVAAESEQTGTMSQRLLNMLNLLQSEESAGGNKLLEQAIKITLNVIKELPLPGGENASPRPAPDGASGNVETRSQAAQAQPQPASAEAPARQSAQPAPQPAAQETPAAIRDGLAAAVESTLDDAALSAGEKYTRIREAVTSALVKTFDSMTGAPPAKPEGLLPEKFQAMPEHLKNIASLLGDAAEAAASKPGREALLPPQGFVAKLAEEAAPLAALRFNREAAPETAKLIEDIQQLIKFEFGKTAKPGGEAEAAAKFEQLLKQAASPDLRREIEQLTAHLRDAADMRSSLDLIARNAATPRDTASAAMNLAKNLQLATLSNLVAHNGAAPTEAFVTFFPIQVGDRVEIGRLKVFRNMDPEGRKGKVKEIDPDNANLVIFLDTQFMGHSAVKINTARGKLNCAIEVENKRIKKALDKYLPELKEALKGTSRFELDGVSVNVPKPRAAAAAGDAKRATDVPRISTIDMKI